MDSNLEMAARFSCAYRDAAAVNALTLIHIFQTRIVATEKDSVSQEPQPKQTTKNFNAKGAKPSRAKAAKKIKSR